jgi:hypothetical protein
MLTLIVISSPALTIIILLNSGAEACAVIAVSPPVAPTDRPGILSTNLRLILTYALGVGYGTLTLRQIANLTLDTLKPLYPTA